MPTIKPYPPLLPSKRKKQAAHAKKQNASKCTVNVLLLEKCAHLSALATDAQMITITRNVSLKLNNLSNKKI